MSIFTKYSPKKLFLGSVFALWGSTRIGLFGKNKMEFTDSNYSNFFGIRKTNWILCTEVNYCEDEIGGCFYDLNKYFIRPIRVIHNGNEIKYSECAIRLASENGHIDVLNWFYNKFGKEIKYTHWAIDWKSDNGHINILNWFYLKLIFVNLCN